MPKDHVSRLIVSLVRESLNLSAIGGSYTSGLGQPPFDSRMLTALLLPGMTICIESYIGEDGGAEGIKLEEQVLVTENGCAVMSTFPFEGRLM